MSDLNPVEKRIFENIFGMSSGYVLDFLNRIFSEFVLESTGLEIYNVKYSNEVDSKANRLRAFWKLENNC